MKSIMLAAFAALSLTLLFVSPCLALFADQAGLNDWTKQHIGEVNVAVATADKLIVSTNQNVLAALTLDSGSIVWRRVLPPSEPVIEAVLVEKDTIVTWSKQYVRVWTSDGQLLWDQTAKEIRDVTFADATTLLVLTSEKLAAYTLASGQSVAKLSKDGLALSATSALLVAAGLPRIVSADQKDNSYVIKVLDTAGTVNEYPAAQGSSFAVLAKSTLIFRSVDDKTTVTAKDFVSGKTRSIEIEHGGEIQSRAGGAGVAITDDKHSTFLHVDEKGDVVTAKLAADASKALGPNGLVWTLSSNQIALKRPGQPETVFKHELDSPVHEGWTTSSNSLLITHVDGRLVHYKVEGASLKSEWTREEALAAITSIVSTSMPHNFGANSQQVGLVGALVQSVQGTMNAGGAMMKSVSDAVLQAIKGGEFDLKSVMESSEEERARFGFNRVLVALTNKKRLFGIHSETAAILWARNLDTVTNPLILVLHDSDPDPRFMVLDTVTGKGEVVSAVSGKTSLSSVKSITGGKKVIQMMALDSAQADKTKTALIVAQGGEVYEWPHPAKRGATSFMHIFDRASKEFAGYRIEPGAKKASSVWSMNFPSDVELVGYASPAQIHDPLSSPVRALGDGSLLVKYSNPNLVSLVLQDESGLKVYVVDTASGRVVHRNSHKEGSKPVHAVRFENWLVYSFWNTKAKRHEIISATLYEKTPISKRQLNPWSAVPKVLEANVSGFAPVELNVVQRTFLLPGADITALGVTTTLRGIAAKNLLVSLGGTGQLLMLDQRFIDPRRTSGAPTEDEKLEGLFPYSPELPITPTHVLSYYRGAGERGAHTIYAAPALLESTCTIVAAGLDLFKGRASPSGAFDLLAEDFNYTLLVLLIFGLAVGVVFLRSLERRKSLTAAWA